MFIYFVSALISQINVVSIQSGHHVLNKNADLNFLVQLLSRF